MAHLGQETPKRSADSELVRRALQQDEAAVRAIVQANNRRLYRVARSITRDDGDAEDILQEAYLRAFSALGEFRGDSSLSTWLTRIVLNEALQRRRRRVERPIANELPPRSSAEIIPFPLFSNPGTDPERDVAQREICGLLERAIDELPEDFRTVLIVRVIEGLSTEEAAELLAIRPETVKSRLHRARRLLKAALADHVGPLFSDVFPFDGARCTRIADTVVKRLKLRQPPSGTFET